MPKNRARSQSFWEPGDDSTSRDNNDSQTLAEQIADAIATPLIIETTTSTVEATHSYQSNVDGKSVAEIIKNFTPPPKATFVIDWTLYTIEEGKPYEVQCAGDDTTAHPTDTE